MSLVAETARPRKNGDAMKRLKRLVSVALLLATLLAGCGGGGGDDAPQPLPSPEEQKSWTRAHLADIYLWNTEIVDVNPAYYPLAPDYFDALLVRSRDRFSFSMPAAAAYSQMQEGKETGFGVRWGRSASGKIFAFYVDPNSPAAPFISRGSEITAINGRTVAGMPTDTLFDLLYPEGEGVATDMIVRPPGMIVTQAVTLHSAPFTTTTVAPPVIIPLASGGKAGYLLFNDHFLTAEAQLVTAMTYFRQQGVSEVVLDLRYNGGGYLFIAKELASMLGGATVEGNVFEKLLFNGNHPEKTNDRDNTLHFSLEDRSGASLPQLGLQRLFVLTGHSTCSASESLINGLLPFMPVVRIGSTTCGKPYGFIQTDFAEQAYFAIQFEGVNANGRDDYMDGFAPTCSVPDDLTYPLGDAREARLNAALYYMSNNACPPVAAAARARTFEPAAAGGGDVRLLGRKPSLKLVP